MANVKKRIRFRVSLLTLGSKMAEQGEDTFSFKAKADAFFDFEKVQVAIGENNEHLISCVRCKSKILKPGEGTLVEKEVRDMLMEAPTCLTYCMFSWICNRRITMLCVDTLHKGMS